MIGFHSLTKLLASAILLITLTPAAAQELQGSRGVSLAALVRVVSTHNGTAYDPPAVYRPALFARLRGSGVELVRLVVRPTPMLTGSPAARLRARSQVLTMVNTLRRAGLSTIIDIHAWPPDTVQDQAKLICTAEGAAAMEAMLTGLAGDIARAHSSRIALELLNEPSKCTVSGKISWPMLQQHLVRRVRAVAPRLPLVVTGPGGQLDDLLALDPRPYAADPLILFSFHFYEPFIFTTPIYYHAPPPPFPSTVSTVASKVALAGMDRSAMNAQELRDLWGYLTKPADTSTLTQRFRRLKAWRQGAGIAANRILLGEFGVVRGPGEGTVDDHRNVAMWTSTVARLAQAGSMRAIFWLWPVKPGFSYDAARAGLRPDLAAAIGLGRVAHP
jgi:hypothetical protein